MKLIYVAVLSCFCLLGCSNQEKEEDELGKIVSLEDDKTEWSLPEEGIEEPLQTTEEATSE
jgi:uncharacterized lipoprotein NlpE involved in copper resistance